MPQTARDAKACYLVLNHILPLLALPGLEKAFPGDAAAKQSGRLRVAADGDYFSMRWTIRACCRDSPGARNAAFASMNWHRCCSTSSRESIFHNKI